MNEYAKYIIQIVNSHPGITGVDLNIAVMNRISPVKWDTQIYIDALRYCISDKLITVFHFKIHGIENTKAIYFPANTTQV